MLMVISLFRASIVLVGDHLISFFSRPQYLGEFFFFFHSLIHSNMLVLLIKIG